MGGRNLAAGLGRCRPPHIARRPVMELAGIGAEYGAARTTPENRGGFDFRGGAVIGWPLLARSGETPETSEEAANT